MLTTFGDGMVKINYERPQVTLCDKRGTRLQQLV